MAAVGWATVTVLFGWLLGDELVGVPGLLDPIPAVRIFPALISAIGALSLLEPWHYFEVPGALSIARHRSRRYAVGVAVTACAGWALGYNAGARSILVLGLVFFAALALAVGVLGRLWWILVALALYGQLFIQQYDRFDPGLGWGFAAVVMAFPFYLLRGAATLGRSPT